ncbi:hypothetical protein COV15_01315 [Candidatus Woesearchaeota archaeon CG10_big_fil_rev_8_21_14_0_10_34_12]|nr:MAG: hypothetical protein COV15_01315 [Candidatus Woesearchaeota archaeon CG10_big_fil_rev_8_21_14_0_10_34_12]
MRFIGFSLEKVNIEKKKEIKEKYSINSNIDIKSIEKGNVDLMKNKEVYIFKFSFIIQFEPSFASLDFNGSVAVLFEPSESKNILKKWKNKKIDDSIRIPLFNMIMNKCNIKAIKYEEDLNLPVHIPFPTVRAEDQTSGKANYVQ